MHLKNLLFLIISIAVYTLSNSSRLLPMNSNSSPNKEFTWFSYRTMLFEKTDPTNTAIQPDDYSSPLRVSKEELGRFVWAFLHSMAAAYPVAPTDEDQRQLLNFLNSIPYLYPCKMCAGHFGEMLKDYPPLTDSRSNVVQYICFLHNKVNKRLGKPIFDCAKASQYWGGDCGCAVTEYKDEVETDDTTDD